MAGKGLNNCEFIGRLGADPVIKYTEGGLAIANFSLACDDSYTKDGERVEKTEWVRCVAFNKLAEIIGQYVTKGSSLFVRTKVQSRSWDDQNSGEKKYMTEFVVQDMIMLGGGKQRDQADSDGDDEERSAAQRQREREPKAAARPAQPRRPVAPVAPIDDEDLPF